MGIAESRIFKPIVSLFIAVPYTVYYCFIRKLLGNNILQHPLSAIDLVDVIGVNISELGLYPQKVVV